MCFVTINIKRFGHKGTAKSRSPRHQQYNVVKKIVARGNAVTESMFWY